VIPLLQVAGVVIPADVLADFDSVRMDVRDRVQGALDD
jgi:hypothetical protein